MTDNDTELYLVVRNDEEQYSIWWADREVPAGWLPIGEARPKADCLAHIEEAWTDMRPRSVREQMEADTSRGPHS